MSFKPIFEIVWVVSLIVAVLSILSIVGLHLYDSVVLFPTYNRAVHSHMENAYFANTPELMKKELLLSVSGMKELGLKEDMYSVVLPWEMTPEKRMDYQFSHLESIISRIDSVGEWRKNVYEKGGTQESLGDVYEIKMDNLRNFLKEDSWSDWIAEGAFYANVYSWFVWANILLGWLLVLSLISTAVSGARVIGW